MRPPRKLARRWPARRLAAAAAAAALGGAGGAAAQPYPPADRVLAPRADAPSPTRHAAGATGFLGGLTLPLPAGTQAQDDDPGAAARARARAYFASQAPMAVELLDTGSATAPHGVVTQHVQALRGVPIEGTFASALVRGSQLAFARHLLVVPPELDPTPSVEADATATPALAGAEAEGLAGARLGAQAPELVITFFADVAHLAFRSEAVVERPAGTYALYVDAHDGSYLGSRRTSSDAAVGQVTATVNDLCQNGPTVEEPLPFIQLSGGGQTDAGGQFAASDMAITVTFGSPYVSFNDQSGPLPGPAPFTLQPAPAANTLALTTASQLQLDNYRNVLAMRHWLVGHEAAGQAQRAWANKRLTANINIQQTCNAYFAPGATNSINLFAAGGGCPNSGTIPNVVHHEFGHGIQYNSGNGNTFDSMNAEGLADTASIFYDPTATLKGATGLLDSACLKPFRTCDNTFTFCRSGCTFSVFTEGHSGGQAICGAWYEVRKGMMARYGLEQGIAQTNALFLKYLTMISGNMADTYQAAIAGDDDDDGNPANGTRHSCEVNQAFAGAKPHFPDIKGSLVPNTPSLALAHTPPGQVPAAAPLTVSATLTPHPICDPQPRLAAQVHYLVGAETTVRSAAMQAGEKGYVATLADVAAPATVRYWIDATLDGVAFRYPYPGAGAFDPTAVPVIFQTLRYGDDAVVTQLDFDADAGGAVRTTDAADGRSDWEWGKMHELGSDPLAAATGDKAWGLNLLAGGDTTGRTARTSTLTLAPVQLSDAAEVRLMFWSAQLNPGPWHIDVNGTQVAAATPGKAFRRDPGWLFTDVDITQAVAGSAAATVKFVATGNTAGQVPLSMWAIDGVRITARGAATAAPDAATTAASDTDSLAATAHTLGCHAAGEAAASLLAAAWAGRRARRRRG